MKLLALAAVLLLGGCAALVTHYPPEHDLPFSNAVRVGNTLYVAGHLGLDDATGLAPTDPETEARLLLDAFVATLARSGATPDDLVQVTVFCSDVSLYERFNAVYREAFTGPFPARAFVGSGTLLRDCRFEMMGVAVLP